VTTARTPAARRVDGPAVVPDCYHVQQILAERITSGEWTPGALVPGAHELCMHHDVRRIVVWQAPIELHVEG
jgi:DNA-binding GntR family transcriptional regulator